MDAGKTFGVCTKSLDGIVESQDSACKNICGDQIGKKCKKGCMQHYEFANSKFKQGVRLSRNVTVDGSVVDSVLINDGNQLTTIIFDKKKAVAQQLEEIQKFKLSKSELNVIDKFLQGYSNAEIATKLFISKATLKTHLNNIYKKIPIDLKDQIIALRQTT